MSLYQLLRAAIGPLLLCSAASQLLRLPSLWSIVIEWICDAASGRKWENEGISGLIKHLLASTPQHKRANQVCPLTAVHCISVIGQWWAGFFSLLFFYDIRYSCKRRKASTSAEADWVSSGKRFSASRVHFNCIFCPFSGRETALIARPNSISLTLSIPLLLFSIYLLFGEKRGDQEAKQYLSEWRAVEQMSSSSRFGVLILAFLPGMTNSLFLFDMCEKTKCQSWIFGQK